MTTQSKSYMNFLGGEVSPNAYKRLDMAGNSKWFETAKNIYFGTTGDLYNRHGFKRVNDSAHLDTDKVKLIPFVFNRDNAYCIEFNSVSFSVLKNGVYLKDGLDAKISVNHPGMTLADLKDLSYVQTGDILYLCSSTSEKIFSIVRHAENDWRWEEFQYEIPPMRSVNSDTDKEVTFSAATGYANDGYFSVEMNCSTGTFVGVTIDVLISGVRTTIYTSNVTSSSLDDIVADFNTNIAADSPFSSARKNGTSILFYVKANSGFANMTDLRVKLGAGSMILQEYVFDEGYPNFTYLQYDNIQVYAYPVMTTKTPSGGGYYAESPYITHLKIRNFTKQNNEILVAGEKPGQYQDYTYDFTLASQTQPTAALNQYFRDVNNYASTNYYTASDEGYYRDSVQVNRNWGDYILELSFYKRFQADNYISSNGKYIVIANQVYGATANFDFFANKQAGDIFAVDSIYSPSVNGKPGENKSYSAAITGPSSITTDPFWSNGTWRFVNSGLFAGTIQLQYSYDGENWYTHRTFSSSIRTENSISYGTNYNEYGTLDVDDNVLLRLKLNISSSTNLRLTLDTESFKARSYYKIVEKDITYPNTKAVVQCVKYPIGTPGITDEIPNTDTYAINPISDWSESAWSKVYGMPKVCFYYQNRLGFASTKKDPQTIWFSRTNNFKDFSTRVEYEDDDPITISALNSNGISDISWVSSAKKLFVFTADYEYGIRDEGALTQANKQLLSFTAYGSEEIEPRIISNRIVFVERGGQAIRALVYDYSQENYEAPDLTIPFKHLLTNEYIVSSEYIPGDYKAFIMLTSAGRMLVFKYIPEQKIEACSWFKHADGSIQNVCVVNNGTSYDMYITVAVDGKKYVEYMHIFKQTGGVYLDSFKEYKYTSDVEGITDTEYFEPGKTYIAMINNNSYKVIAGGDSSIILPVKAKDILVGKAYVSEATMIEPNLMFQNGTTNYNRKNLFKAHFSFLDSVGFSVGTKNNAKSFKKVYAIKAPSIEEPFKLYSGDKNFVIQSSYLEPNMLSFVQEEPYNMHITNAEIEVDYGGK